MTALIFPKSSPLEDDDDNRPNSPVCPRWIYILFSSETPFSFSLSNSRTYLFLCPRAKRRAADSHARARDDAKTADYDLTHLNAVIDKVIEASVKFDQRSIGPAGLKGFDGQTMVSRPELARLGVDASDLSSSLEKQVVVVGKPTSYALSRCAIAGSDGLPRAAATRVQDQARSVRARGRRSLLRRFSSPFNFESGWRLLKGE